MKVERLNKRIASVRNLNLIGEFVIELIVRLIDREINHAQNGRNARILAKLNNLVDPQIVDKLYEASQAGVVIKLIVRGMCSLNPGISGLSENIRVTSIVDRFLEHTRLFIFDNKGDPDIFISSADWMGRNLDQRVEVTVPIYDDEIKKRLIAIMEIQLADNQKARIIDGSLKNSYVPRGNKRKIRSQEAIYRFLSSDKDKAQKSEKRK